MYKKGYDFTSIKTDKTDLGSIVKELYNIELPQVCRDVAGSIAINYGVDEILMRKWSDSRTSGQESITR